MTKAQAKRRQEATPRMTAQAIEARERRALEILASIGYRVTSVGPFGLYIQREGK